MILQCFFLPTEHLVVSFLLGMSNQTRWKAIPEAANSFRCMPFNCQLPVIPHVTFFQPLCSTNSRCSKPWSISSSLKKFMWLVFLKRRMPCLQCFHSALMFLFSLFVSFFFTSSDICSWSNGRPHQSNILDLGNRLSVRVSRWIPSKWWKFHTSWSMLRRAYLGGLVARAYFERCQVSTSGKYDMGMIHSQVIRYLRVSALTAKK